MLLTNCQLVSWLMLSIASLPNTNSDGVCYIVVCTVGRMVNMVDERIPTQGLSLSKSIYWIKKECKILLIFWCILSTIAFAYGFLTLMELQSIL